MVARIDFVKSIGDVLHYHDKKVEASSAKLLFASGFPADTAHLAAKTSMGIFSKLISRNIRSKTNAVHVSLNFIKEDSLSPGKLIQIAGDYMKRIGLGKQPFLVYQHFDAGHPHIHVVSVIIKKGGQRIFTHNLAYKPSKMAAMEIEQQYALHPSPSKFSRQEIQLEAVPLHRLHYGEMSTWRAISSVVGQVTKNYNYGSLQQLNAVLNQFGVMADAGRPGSRLHANKGLVYYLLDEKGNRLGRAIKSSDVNGKPTLKQLERRFMANALGRESYEKRLRYHLDKLLAGTAAAVATEAHLRKQGIRIIFQKDPEGKVFGATFIDNGARAVFNDWELGEGYGYKMFLELELKALSEKARQSDLQLAGLSTGQSADALLGAAVTSNMTAAKAPPPSFAYQLYPGSELPVMETLTGHLYDDDDKYRQSFALAQAMDQKPDQGIRLRR